MSISDANKSKFSLDNKNIKLAIVLTYGSPGGPLPDVIKLPIEGAHGIPITTVTQETLSTSM